MSFNKELFKNKIVYRASYRGTKEMDKLMQGFVRSIIDKIDENDLKVLNEFVNMDDQLLISIKKKLTLQTPETLFSKEEGGYINLNKTNLIIIYLKIVS